MNWWALWLVLGALVGIVLYEYAAPQQVPTWVRSWLPSLPEHTGTLYRWRDDQGRMQITDKPPKNRPYEEVHYRSDTNVLPGAARP